MAKLTTWATASVRIVGGSVGRPSGPVWLKYGSFIDTFLMPTIR